MIKHVFATPIEPGTGPRAIRLGAAETLEGAIKLASDHGYTVDHGGVDEYDADDGPRVYEYEPDGHGAFGVPVTH